MNFTRPISVVVGEGPPTVFDMANTGQRRLFLDGSPPLGGESPKATGLVLQRRLIGSWGRGEAAQPVLAVVHRLPLNFAFYSPILPSYF